MTSGENLAAIRELTRDFALLVDKLKVAQTPKDAYALWHYIVHDYIERVDERFEQFDSKELGWDDVTNIIQFPPLQELMQSGQSNHKS